MSVLTNIICRTAVCLVQVAGYVVDYNSGLSYATVKGAGGR